MAAIAPLLRPLSVLVIDDDRDNADSLKMLLKLFGHTPEVAYDGASAIRAVEAHQPDVLLIDLVMPAMSGYELLKRLGGMFRCRPLLVAVTGYGTAKDLKQCREVGFDRHLLKPFDTDELETLLGDHAERLAAV